MEKIFTLKQELLKLFVLVALLVGGGSSAMAAFNQSLKGTGKVYEFLPALGWEVEEGRWNFYGDGIYDYANATGNTDLVTPKITASSNFVIFFDVSLKSTKPVTLKKNFKLSEIKGKGGTNFQAPFDFFMEHTEYDGLILFTDGEGAIPSVGEKRKAVLWILTSRLFWEKARPWIEKQLKHRCTYIP